jgi:hypothetical protein
VKERSSIEEEGTTPRRTPVRWLIGVVGISLALGIGGATLNATAATVDSPGTVRRYSSESRAIDVRDSTAGGDRKGNCPNDRGESSTDSSGTETSV